MCPDARCCFSNLILDGLFDREAIVDTFPVVIATGEDLEALRAASLAEAHCLHSVRHARYLGQIVQADLLIGSVGGQPPQSAGRQTRYRTKRNGRVSAQPVSSLPCGSATNPRASRSAHIR